MEICSIINIQHMSHVYFHVPPASRGEAVAGGAVNKFGLHPFHFGKW